MREITAVAIDNLMQMLPTLLPHAETMHGLLGVGQECAQLATVATVAGQLGGAAIIRRFDRNLRDARCQLGPASRQPVRDRAVGRGGLRTQPRFQGEDRGHVRVDDIILVVGGKSVVNQSGQRLVGINDRQRLDQRTEQCGSVYFLDSPIVRGRLAVERQQRRHGPFGQLPT